MMSERDWECVFRHFDFALPDCTSLLQFGRKATYLVGDALGAKSIVRCYPATTSVVRILAQQSLLALIASRGVATERVVRGQNGHTIVNLPSGCFVTVSSYVRGSPIEHPTPRNWALLADAIGGLHVALRDAERFVKLSADAVSDLSPITVVNSTFSELRSAGFLLPSLPERVLDALSTLDLRSQIIHGDLSLGNILVEHDHVSFIDFDDLGIGPAAYDTVAPICVGGVGRYPDAVESYLNRCLDLEVIRSRELKALPLLCALRQLWLLRWEVTISTSVPPADRVRHILSAVDELVTAYENEISLFEVLEYASVY